MEAVSLTMEIGGYGYNFQFSEVLCMEIKKIDETQFDFAIDLIWSTFLRFEAPDY